MAKTEPAVTSGVKNWYIILFSWIPEVPLKFPKGRGGHVFFRDFKFFAFKVPWAPPGVYEKLPPGPPGVTGRQKKKNTIKKNSEVAISFIGFYFF